MTNNQELEKKIKASDRRSINIGNYTHGGSKWSSSLTCDYQLLATKLKTGNTHKLQEAEKII